VRSGTSGGVILNEIRDAERLEGAGGLLWSIRLRLARRDSPSRSSSNRLLFPAPPCFVDPLASALATLSHSLSRAEALSYR